MSTFYLLLFTKTTTTNKIPIQMQQRWHQARTTAFIITENCNSLRFNATKGNIERVFPNFFDFSCYLYVPLNDSRIHPIPLSLVKRYSSNLLAFLDLWTYKIANESKTNEFKWTFIFEDDVNFTDPSNVSLPNYIAPLEELMYNPEVQMKHGFLYLGICGPIFDNNSQPLISKNTYNSLYSRKGCGLCLHATGITAKRAELFWTEISSYRPNIDELFHKQVQDYCIRSKSQFYTLGSNFHYPPNTEHYGIAYQDRARFPSTIT